MGAVLGHCTGLVSAGALLCSALCVGVIAIHHKNLSVRLAYATGKNLAQICHDEVCVCFSCHEQHPCAWQYPKSTRVPLWLMIELAIIASDIQASA